MALPLIAIRLQVNGEIIRINYIVAVDPAGVRALDAINIKYPNLYADGASWCTLVKTFNGFKLYKVNAP